MKKDSWLISDSFLKRAFAIYGYNLVAGLIIAAVIMALMLPVMMFLLPVRMVTS